MKQKIRMMAWAVALTLGAALLAAGPASAWTQQTKTKTKQQPKAQDQSDQQPDQQKQADDQPPPPPPPKPVLTQKVTLRSSHQTKDTASAGFNGVGPDGKVKEALLNANPSPAARQKAAQLTLLEADASDVAAFAKEGHLNPPPAKTGEKKGK
jgi:hypothetical protein